jgi:hypothetical protein
MNKIFVIILLSFLGNKLVYSQFNFDPAGLIDQLGGDLNTDRPGQALNAKTCGMLAFQIQTGLNYENFVAGIDNSASTYFVPTNLRFGITNKIELNTSFYYLSSNSVTLAGPNKTNGFTSPEIGIRYAFMKGERWKPSMALQSNMSFSSKKGAFQQDKLGSSFYLATSNSFRKISLNTNLGIAFLGDGELKPNYSYVLNLGFKLSDKWGAFVEGFGLLNSLQNDDNRGLKGDAGFSFAPIKYLQFDVFGGWLAELSSNEHWFIEAGVSWKFSFIKYMAKKKYEQIKDKLPF